MGKFWKATTLLGIVFAISASTIACTSAANSTLTVMKYRSYLEEQMQEEQGQPDIVYKKNLVSFRDGFLAVDNGVATYYSAVDAQGTEETEVPFAPLQAFGCEGNAVILGAEGALAIYENRQWTTGQQPDIEGIVAWTQFNNLYVAISQDFVATSADLITWEITPTGFDAPAIGVAATESYVVAGSENGVFLRSENGVDWTPFYYNAYYGEAFTFQKLICAESTFYALAVDTDQMPILTSARSGLVWSQRTAEIYNDDGTGIPDVREYQINDVIWDGSQFMLIGNEGAVIALPSCSKCNSMSTIDTKNWSAGLCEGGIMALLAEDGTVEIISTDAVRQTAISVEETKNQMDKGTPLIDVRTAEEYAEGHIEGSVNIPLADLEEQLRLQYTDYSQTLIFYCGTGMRAQKGLDAAQEIGYQDVYNMGAMEDWYD